MGPGPLVPINGTLTGNEYAQILLNNIPEVKTSLNVQTASMIEDRCRIHNTQDVLRTKENLNVRDLDLPAYSPDLNIIENVWSILKTRVADRAPGNFEELE